MYDDPRFEVDTTSACAPSTARNAPRRQTYRELEEVVRGLGTSSDVRGLVITVADRRSARATT